MMASGSNSLSKPVQEFPYLKASGVSLDLKQIQASLEEDSGNSSSTLSRFPDTLVVTNGIISDICRFVKPLNLSNASFFSVAKQLVPLSVVELLDNHKNFASKLKTFEKKLKKKEKNRNRDPDALAAFIGEPFLFESRPYQKLTPQKKKLKKENIALTTEKHRLTEKLDELVYSTEVEKGKLEKKIKDLTETEIEKEELLLSEQSRIEELQTELAENEKLITEYEDKIEQLKLDRTSLQQSINGIRSGAARKRKSHESASHTITTSSLSTTPKRPRESSCPISSSSSSDKNDLIVVHSRTGHILHGQRYLGEPSGQKKTSGFTNTYIEFPDKSKPCSSVTRREVQKRAQLLDMTAITISGGTDEDNKLLYAQLVRSNRPLFTAVLPQAGLDLQKKMTPLQSLQIQSMLRIST